MGRSAIVHADSQDDEQRTRAGIRSLRSGSANIATKVMSEPIAEDPWLAWGQRL